MRARHGSDFTIHVQPDVNHTWIRNGGICQQQGEAWSDGWITLPWLDARFPGWRAARARD